MKEYLRFLLGVESISAYRDIDTLSTISNMMSDYPPCFVTDCLRDPLIGESRAILDRMRKLGVESAPLLLKSVGTALVHDYHIEYDKPIFDICVKGCLRFLETYRS